MGQEWRELRSKYPEDDPQRRGWRTLALGIAIAALAEEEYRVNDWRELLPKRKGSNESAKRPISDRGTDGQAS
jgi:hypothetical protein